MGKYSEAISIGYELKVLVADDNPDHRNMLASYAERAAPENVGVLVNVVGSADALLHGVVSGNFDVLITDDHMEYSGAGRKAIDSLREGGYEWPAIVVSSAFDHVELIAENPVLYTASKNGRLLRPLLEKVFAEVCEKNGAIQ